MSNSEAEGTPGTSGNVLTGVLNTKPETLTNNQKKKTKRSNKKLKSMSEDIAEFFLSETGDNTVSENTMEPEIPESTKVGKQSKKKISASKGKGKKTQNKSNIDSPVISASEEDISNDSQLSTSNTDKTTTANASKTTLLPNAESSSQEELELDSSHVANMYSDPQPSTSSSDTPSNITLNKKRVNLYAPDTGSQMYQAKGNLVTPPIITKNLPKVFQFLPIHGKPDPNTTLHEFYRNKVREYVGCGLTDDEFNDLENYCSPELLKTGNEIKMQTNVPVMGLLTANILHNHFTQPEQKGDPPNLVILKKNKHRLEKDTRGLFTKKLKYRGVRILPFAQEENADEEPTAKEPKEDDDVELEPGTDILYRVRIYRPYTYSLAKDRFTRSRHSVFCCDVLLTGRHMLTALRDRFVCHNDFDMRVDVSSHPDVLPTTKAKEVFPSGFLFINNVFYVDTREGCIDYSAPIRDWAIKRNIGDFPKKDMCKVRMEDLVLKLGYPEVYIHQGNCEHIFVFSEVRLLNPNDPLRFSNYPCSTAIAQNQTVYCTTCAEFSAKWIVVGSDRVPFDPGFFCDTCFKQYMYKDGQKIGNFKAYRYRGNALNVLKPQ